MPLKADHEASDRRRDTVPVKERAVRAGVCVLNCPYTVSLSKGFFLPYLSLWHGVANVLTFGEGEPIWPRSTRKKKKG